MRKLSKDHLIDGQVYSMGTEYEIIKEGSNNWPGLDPREWESMTVNQLEQYLDNYEVNARDKNGSTPLLYALENKSNRKVIQFLIDTGADVNARNKYRITPLMMASAYSSNRQVIQSLIDNRADVTPRDSDGWTALMWASSENRNPDVIYILIDNGADVNVRDKSGSTALTIAYTNKNRDVAKLLRVNGARK